MVGIIPMETKAILAILVAISLVSLQSSSTGHRIQQNRQASELREHLQLYRITKHLLQLELARAPRMRRVAFCNPLQLVYPVLNRDKSPDASSSAGVVHSDKRLGITLRFLSGCSYRDILMCLQVSQSTTYAIFHVPVLVLN